MSGHRTWRERLGLPAEHHPEPVFEPSDDPVLVAFAQLFAESELVTFDANKRLRTDAFSPLYDGETELLREVVQRPELWMASWTPIWSDPDPVTGLRSGHD